MTKRRHEDDFSRAKKRHKSLTKGFIICPNTGEEKLDWEYITQLPELQREAIIYDFNERKKEREDREKAKLELQQAQNEFSNQPVILHNSQQGGIGIRDGDSDDDEDDEEQEPYEQDYNNYDYNNHNETNNNDISNKKPKKKEDEHVSEKEENELTVRDLRGVQLTRKELEKRLFEPYFESYIQNLYVRVWIGNRNSSNGNAKPVYRICKIIKTEEYPKLYKLSDKKRNTKVGLLLEHGKQQRVFKIVVVSDTAFSHQEFETWKFAMQKDRRELPTPNELKDLYLNAIVLIKGFTYDESAIRKMMREKKKHKLADVKTIVNLPKYKSQLLNELIDYKENDIEYKNIISLIKEIEKEIENRQEIKQKKKVNVSRINMRNKEKNIETYRKTRMLEIQKKKQFQLRAEKNNDSDADIELDDDLERSEFSTRATTIPTIETFGKIVDKKENNQKTPSKTKKLKKNETDKDFELEIGMNDGVKNASISDDDIRNVDDSFDDNMVKLRGEELVVAGSKNVLINDSLWNVIHEISKKFCMEYQDIELPKEKKPLPLFGRNTSQSNYGVKYAKTPNDAPIISLQDYKNRSYLDLI